MKYSGAEWLPNKVQETMSPLGREVADIIGQVFMGIYHIDREITKVDWANPNWIEFCHYGELSTFDYCNLTSLVVLCHDRCIRLSISPASPRVLRLMFHLRTARDGEINSRHPTIEKHIEIIRGAIGLEAKE